MTNLSFHLFQLQKADLRLDQIDSRVQKINDLVNNNPSLQDADNKLKMVEEHVARKTSELAELETAAHTKNIKIEQSESALYKGTIQNPKELADLQKEIASLKRTLSTIEEEQLEKLAEFEALSSEESLHKQTRQSIFEEWQVANRSLLFELEELQKEKGKILKERQATSDQVGIENLSMYEKLRVSKNRIAVTSVEDESCVICGAEITAAIIQRAKSSSILTTCPSCGRILYTG